MTEFKPLLDTNYSYYSDKFYGGYDQYDRKNIIVEDLDVKKGDTRNQYSRLLLITLICFFIILIYSSIFITINSSTATQYSSMHSQTLLYSSTVLSLSIHKNRTSDKYYINDDKTSEYSRYKSSSDLLVEGLYELDVGQNGWNYLTIESPSNEKHIDDYDKSQQLELNHYLRIMLSMGFMEGFLTCHDMMDWYANMYNGLFEDGSNISIESLHFLESNYQWTKEQADRYWLVDDYWLSVQGLLSQLDGLLEGVRSGCPYAAKHHDSDDRDSRHNMHIDDDDDRYYNGIYLPSFGSQGEIHLIHLLIVNSNGDLFQIERNLRG